MRPFITACILALLPTTLLAQQGGAPLRKSDLVRFLTGTTYSKREIASIVRRTCLAFVPTARDRQDLRELGATTSIFHEIDVCVKNGNRNQAQRAAAAPPPPIQLIRANPSISAVAGTVAYFTVELHRGTEPVAAQRLVLTGTAAIPDAARQEPSAVTDSHGRATFTVLAGTRTGTYHLTVASADGTPLQGDGAVILTTVPAAPALATATPSVLSIGTGKRGTRDVTVEVSDPFGNPVPRQTVQLTPLVSRPSLTTQTQQTNDSGDTRFTVPLTPLRSGDTLAVMIGARRFASVTVSAAAEVTAEMIEAERRMAEARPDAEASYDSVLSVDPTNVAALVGRGDVRSSEGKTEPARQDFQAALRAQPGNAAAYTGLGYNDARRGNYTAAIADFQDALKASPDYAAAATGLAYSELWQHDPDQASRRAEVIAAPRPLPYPAQAADRFRTGIAQTVRRNLDSAVTSLSAAISAAPRWADAYYNRALVNQATHHPDQAIADYQRYLELRPAARDRAEVASRIDALHHTPNSALVHGLILPGLGQFYTGRPVLGAVVFAGAAGGTVLALTKKKTFETRSFTDPFGRVDTFQVPVEKRPNVAVGVAVAGSLWLLGAFEAALHAGHAIGNVSLPSAIGGPGTKSAARLELAPLVTSRPSGPAFGAALTLHVP